MCIRDRGNVEDKVTKNLLASRGLYTFIKDMKTVGVIGEDKARKIVEIAAPVGLIAAVIPTTNPTSTVIFKSISSLKSRNAVVFSPHPRAIQSSLEAARIMETVAKRAGDVYKRQVLPYVDLVLYDLKHMDNQKHKEYVGTPNAMVLNNAR